MRGLTKMEKEKIETKANELLKHYNEYITDESFVDIVGIARAMGFVVGQATLDDGEDGFIIIDNSKKELLGIKTNKLIVVNKNRDFNLRRFIVAHEIGHYYLECGDSEKAFASREHKTGKSDKENEIDYFAACMLMPSEKFIKKYNEYKKDFDNNAILTFLLSKQFGVTIKTCERRFEELALN